MKLYLLLPLATLTIGLAVPALAQQEKTTVDAQTVQQLHAIGSKSDEAFKKGDAGARAALFTEDAILLGQMDQSKVAKLSRSIIRICSRRSISSRM
jgi:hypothetical protein